LERRVGGIFGLRDLVEAAEKYNAGQSDNEELAKGVAAIFAKFGP